jgi:hypothetical protein
LYRDISKFYSNEVNDKEKHYRQNKSLCKEWNNKACSGNSK